MAFAAIDAFGAVVSTYPTDAGGSNRLAVDNASTRLGVAADTGAKLLTEDSVQVLPRAVQTPQAEVVICRLPRRELMWQQPPCAATPHNVEDRVQDLANRV